MKQYNLLIVSGEQKTNELVDRIGSRNKRIRFSFQATSSQEARLLLNSLNIDVLIVDLDQPEIDIRKFNRDCPGTIVWGVARHPDKTFNGVDPLKNIVMAKNDLPSALATELRLLGKSNRKPFLEAFFDSKKQANKKRSQSLGMLAKQ